MPDPVNPLNIAPTGWLSRIPGLKGFWSWFCYVTAWLLWTYAAYLVYKLPGGLAVFGAGMLMTSYVVSPTIK